MSVVESHMTEEEAKCRLISFSNVKFRAASCAVGSPGPAGPCFCIVCYHHFCIEAPGPQRIRRDSEQRSTRGGLCSPVQRNWDLVKC